MKKVISLLLSLMMLLSITAGIDFSAYALASSGSCGDNVSWSFDSTTGTLTISGKGDMWSYDCYMGESTSPFYDDNSIITVIINNGVTSIGNYAFYSCSGLTSVTIPNSVTEISDRAFNRCYELTSITIPKSITSIGEGAFDSCLKLTSIAIPYGVTSIGEWAFSRTGLTSITIPNSVINIGENAFFCSDLKSIVLPNNISTICHSTFSDCYSLTDVTIPNSVTEIGEFAFYNCTGLTSITIPDSVTSIGQYAFWGCTGLKSITIPNSVKNIYEGSFQGCTGLKSITIPNSVTFIGKDAFGDATVRCNYNSYAFKYCFNHSIKMEIIGSPNALNASSFKYTYQKTFDYDKYSHKPKVTVKDGNGQTISSSYYTVKYDNDTKSAGKHKITISFKTPYKGTKTVEYCIIPIIKADKTTYVGLKKKIKVIGAKSNCTYRTSNKKIATVNKKGIITAKKSGKVTITVTVNGASAKKTIKVNPPYIKTNGQTGFDDSIADDFNLKSNQECMYFRITYDAYGINVLEKEAYFHGWNVLAKKQMVKFTNYSFSSSNPNVATISSTGKINLGNTEGKTIVKIKAKYKGKTYKKKVIVVVDYWYRLTAY